MSQVIKLSVSLTNYEFAGYGWGLVEIDVTPYLGKTEKVSVTLPGIVIRKIDAYVSLHGIKSRSNQGGH